MEVIPGRMVSEHGRRPRRMKSLTDILPLDEAVLDRTSKTLTGLLLVTVVKSRVEETVALLDSVVDGLVDSVSICILRRKLRGHT